MKILKIPIVLTAILSTINFQAQTFSSSFEENVFKSYKQDSLNYNFIESLLVIDSTMTKELASKYENKLLSIINNFPPKEDKPKKEQKRVKEIYDKLHNTFFRKYNLDSYFSDVFNGGTYNCVTASALYAYTFDKLGIPYHVKETPSHVFLIVYPNSYKIYLETTAPGAYGFLVPNESEIKKIVDELIAYKLVTQDEVLAKGYMKFYEDYFYGKEFIKESALIGMQYYNKGLTNFSNKKYDQALNNLRKAKVFYTSPFMKPLLKEIMYSKINQLEFNDQDDVDFLIEMLSISSYPQDYTMGNLNSSLYKITEHDDNNSEFIEETIDKFRNIQTEKVRNEAIEFLYEYLAKNAASDEQLDTALRYCDEIFSINPDSKKAQQIVEYVCFKKVMLSSYNESDLELFLEMCEKYGFIKSNKRYLISLAHFYGNISFINFHEKKITSGIDFLDKMEKIIDENVLLDDISKKMLYDLYLKVGNHYYYKEQYKTSYRIFSKGLSYLPSNTDLEKRAKWSKEEL